MWSCKHSHGINLIEGLHSSSSAALKISCQAGWQSWLLTVQLS